MKNKVTSTDNINPEQPTADSQAAASVSLTKQICSTAMNLSTQEHISPETKHWYECGKKNNQIERVSYEKEKTA